MITIRVKKGMDLNITGRPDNRVTRLMDMDRVGVSPVAIPYIKPKLRVKENDRVRQGTTLFADKRNPDIHFVSPGGGTIETIDFGHRRVIRAIVIRLDKEEEREEFGAVEAHKLAVMSRETLAQKLMTAGLWPLIRALPFRDIADPAVTPPAIIVALDSLDPFHPRPSLYLKGARESFFYGLDALKRLAPEVYLVTCREETELDPEIAKHVTHKVRGRYPADDPGVFLYYTRASTAANRCWYINGSDVPLLGRFLASGFYPLERLVAVSAPGGAHHVLTRTGAPLSLLAPEISGNEKYRAITGGLWRGTVTEQNGFLGFYNTAVAVLPSGNQAEFLGFLRPGWRKPGHSRLFLSAFNRGPFTLDTGQHGEARACVNCGSCATVCPVDILPQFTIKSILAGEVEESLAHGMMDCVECGLCTYVCPSKIELSSILQQARRDYYKEQATAENKT